MKLLIQSPVEHDGKPYKEGDTLTIKDDEVAQALVDAKAAIEFVKEAGSKEQQPAE